MDACNTLLKIDEKTNTPALCVACLVLSQYTVNATCVSIFTLLTTFYPYLHDIPVSNTICIPLPKPAPSVPRNSDSPSKDKITGDEMKKT